MSYQAFQRVHFVKRQQGLPTVYECQLNDISIGTIWNWDDNGKTKWEAAVNLPPKPGEPFIDQKVKSHLTFEHAEHWAVETIKSFLENDDRAKAYLIEVPDENDG